MELQGSTFFFPWEVGLMEWLQAHLGEPWISVLSALSMFGEETVMILVLGFLYWGWNKRMGTTVGLSVLMGSVWNPMLKNIALRHRPYFDHRESIKILRVVEPEADIYDISAQGYSFPSGHSTNAAVTYGSLAVIGKNKWLAVLAVVLPLLVGVSRVAVGAHYPTDVLAGWALGLLAALLIPVLQKRISSRPALYGLLLLTVIPGFFYCKSADYFSSVGLLIGFMGGTLVEEKYVRFENTQKPLWIALRLLGGLICYFILNTLLKLPFPKDFLSSGSYPSLFVRCARYAIIAFLGFGVYPMLFRIVEKGRGQRSEEL